MANASDTRAAVANAIKQLAAIEAAVTEARSANVLNSYQLPAHEQVHDVVRLITATEAVRQLDRLARAAS